MSFSVLRITGFYFQCDVMKLKFHCSFSNWVGLRRSCVRMPPESDIFALSPCEPISILGLSLRRYYLGYSLEYFNLPQLYHYICLTVLSGQTLLVTPSLGGVDLYIPGNGKWKTNMKAIDCPSLPGPNGRIQLRFAEGSTVSSFKLQVRNSKYVET